MGDQQPAYVDAAMHSFIVNGNFGSAYAYNTCQVLPGTIQQRLPALMQTGVGNENLLKSLLELYINRNQLWTDNTRSFWRADQTMETYLSARIDHLFGPGRVNLFPLT